MEIGKSLAHTPQCASPAHSLEEAMRAHGFASGVSNYTERDLIVVNAGAWQSSGNQKIATRRSTNSENEELDAAGTRRNLIFEFGTPLA